MNLSNKITVLLAVVVAIHSAVTVNSIAGISKNNMVFSGTIPVSASDNLFFTYYGVDGQTSQDNLKNHPLLIVVGSPGTSGQYYSLGGIGPVNLQNDMTLAENPNRFTTSANLMFLDLLGSGFSFAADPNSIPTDAQGYGKILSTALNTFIKESALGKSQTLVLAGEGTFIRSLTGLEDIDTLKGVIHLSAWSQMYAIGRYYGIAGLELKLYGESERIAIDSTFTTCYNNIRSAKYYEAHQCLDAIYTFVESKTKNANLFDTRLQSNFTEFLPMIQYYFSQSGVISQWKTPTIKLFETQSAYVFNKTYVDMTKNKTNQLSSFMRDSFSIRHWFVQGQKDYISYYKGLRNWIENQLNFVEKDAFKKAALDDIIVDGKVIGYSKAVKQVAYSQLIDAGHHLFHDSAKELSPLFKSWVQSLTQEARQPNISTE